MTLVVDLFRSLIPPRAKSSPSGWTSFNAPCCHHRGHKLDTRKRGGLRFDHGIVFNCFNCKYTASWQPGRPLTEKFKSLCRWLGAGEDTINAMIFEALKTEAPEYVHEVTEAKAKFTEKELPPDARPINEWVNSNDLESVAEQLEPVISYLVGRGFDPMSNRFYWTPEPGFSDRVILPYFFEGKIVGNTARKIKKGMPKYVSDQHPHFVFNTDEQKDDNKYVFVVEGQFDAYSIDGVGLLTNEVNEQQARIINSLGKKVIVIPDQDLPGLMLIKHAIEYNWSVAFPNWDNDVKDAAEAVSRYGKLFVIVDAIKTAQDGEIKITVAKNNLENKLKRLEQDENHN
jgi:hypothetical protein